MSGYLAGRTVGFLVGQHGVEERELTGPREAVESAGARTVLIAPGPDDVQTTVAGRHGSSFRVDILLRDATEVAVAHLDALVVPDGEVSSTSLRDEPTARDLITAFAESRRPLGAFGHAVGSMLDAGLLEGREVTSHFSLRDELFRVGARWRDNRVVVDDYLITSRASEDVDAFNLRLLSVLDR